MLDKKFRLPTQQKITSSKTIHSSFFIVKITENKLDISRFGFVISKKVSDLATKRNRAKRILRACIEERLGKIQNGFDFLFIGKKELVTARKKELENEIEVLFRKNALFI